MSTKRKTPPKATAAKTPSLPTITNIADYRATATGPVLLHFTKEQWKAALKNGKRVESLLSKHVTFEAVPMPGRDGDMLVSQRGCPKGYSSVLRFIPAGSPNGLTPEPNAYDTLQPQCIPENGGGGERPRPYPFTGCQMVVNLPRQSFRPPFSCASTTCQLGCVLRFVRDGRFFQAGCVCGG